MHQPIHQLKHQLILQLMHQLMHQLSHQLSHQLIHQPTHQLTIVLGGDVDSLLTVGLYVGYAHTVRNSLDTHHTRGFLSLRGANAMPRDVGG